jgi:hypothetical protein
LVVPIRAALMGWCLPMDMLIGGRWQSAASGRTAELADERAEQIAHIISAESGPRSAVAEMTDVKTVILHGRP